MNRLLVSKLLLPAHERLLGRGTFAVYRQMLKSQWLSAQRLRELQLAKLRDLVAVALGRTEAYRQLAGVGFDWRPESLDDLGRLPLLDKAAISAAGMRLVNGRVRGGPIRHNTGGSSGRPLIFYMDKRRQASDKAARMRAHKWWGVEPGDREAYIWGSPVELGRQDRLKNWRDRLTNEMLLSAFELSADSVGLFVERLRRFSPKCLFGYPSSIALMCRLAAAGGLDLKRLGVRVVFCTAEVLYEHQVQTIGEAFGGIPVANGYGSREGGFIAHECPCGTMHVTSESVIVECLKGGRPVGPDEDGEIVITHLDNHATPFIRYRTGDIGRLSGGGCGCGRGLGVMQVVKGRSTDFIIAPDGRWVHALGLIYVVRDLPGVVEYQITQHDVDSITVRLVLDDAFPPDGEQRIRDGFVRRLGPSLRVSLERVDRIPTDASGKFRYVISEPARDRQALL